MSKACTTLTESVEERRNQQPVRIDIIDALRGFCLLGIILAHADSIYRLGTDLDVLSNADNYVSLLLALFIHKKFYTIFAFLFGLSFSIQLKNARSKMEKFTLKYTWRLVILFCIGFLHNLLYPFDILQIYAAMGLLLLVFKDVTGKDCLYMFFFFFLLSSFSFSYKKEIYEFTGYLKIGDSYLPRFVSRQISSGLFFMIIGLFILGKWLGERDLLTFSRNVTVIKKCLLYSILSFIILWLSGRVFDDRLNQLKIFNVFMSVRISAMELMLSAIYVFVFALGYIMFSRISILKFRVFAAVGRMGLTNYIVQTVFFYALFHTNLNFSKNYGLSITVLFAIIFYMVQIKISQWWFNRYKLGPLEWF
uniref:DUF418 domain-containing protein n=1 Tax=Sphingobacterium sp. (strain 21) TaxID=743722 RepID=F4C145_SPHS2